MDSCDAAIPLYSAKKTLIPTMVLENVSKANMAGMGVVTPNLETVDEESA